MSKRRYRQKSGQVMLELLYGKAEYITRTHVTTINISKMAQGMSMRPVRLIDALEWLAEQRLVTDLDVRRYEASMVTRPPEKMVTHSSVQDVYDRVNEQIIEDVEKAGELRLNVPEEVTEDTQTCGKNIVETKPGWMK